MTQYATKENLEKKDYNQYRNVYCGTAKTGFILTILGKWSGSVFKLIYHDSFVLVILYAFLSILYRNVLYYNEYNRKCFELICFYMNGFSKLIPILVSIIVINSCFLFFFSLWAMSLHFWLQLSIISCFFLSCQ